MSEAEQISDRYARMLALMAEQGMRLATDFHDRAQAADDPEQADRLGRAWARSTRAVRQTIALAARLERDRRAAARQDRAEARGEAGARSDRRKDQVRAAVERGIRAAYDESEAEALEADLADLLDEEALYDGFTAEPLDAHIARLCEELELPPPAPAARSAMRATAANPPPQGEGNREAVEGASPSASPDGPAQPLLRPADAGPLLPQGEKDPFQSSA